MIENQENPELIEVKNERITREFLGKSKKFFTENPIMSGKQNRIENQIKTSGLGPVALGDMIKSARPIVDVGFIQLAESFLASKRLNGTPAERALYAEMTTPQFIDRLLQKRPLSDAGYSNASNAVSLDRSISADEGAIAGQLSVSSKTFFTESGNMNTVLHEQHRREGVVIGNVGPRLHQVNSIDHKCMIITPTQNIGANGYGIAGVNNPSLKVWSDHYLGEGHNFPTYEEASQQLLLNLPVLSPPYIRISPTAILNADVYKKRMEAILEPMLTEANARAEEQGTTAFVRMFGLGTGLWGVNRKEQEKLILDVCHRIIRNKNLNSVSDLELSYFTGLTTPEEKRVGVASNGEHLIVLNNGNDITIHFSSNSPAKALLGDNAEKLLVTNYAWNDNAYPGNSYWGGNEFSNSDSAMGRCSGVTELQNPIINPYVRSANLRVANLRVVAQIDGRLEPVQDDDIDVQDFVEQRDQALELEAQARKDTIRTKLTLAERIWGASTGVADVQMPTVLELQQFATDERNTMGDEMLRRGNKLYDLLMSNDPKRVARILYDIQQRVVINEEHHQIGGDLGKGVMISCLPIDALLRMAKIQRNILEREGGQIGGLVNGFYDLLDQFLNFFAKLFGGGVGESDVKKACDVILNPLIALRNEQVGPEHVPEAWRVQIDQMGSTLDEAARRI